MAFGFSAIEDGDVVAAGDELRHHARTDKPRSADDYKSHLLARLSRLIAQLLGLGELLDSERIRAELDGLLVLHDRLRVSALLHQKQPVVAVHPRVVGIEPDVLLMDGFDLLHIAARLGNTLFLSEENALVLF